MSCANSVEQVMCGLSTYLDTSEEEDGDQRCIRWAAPEQQGAVRVAGCRSHQSRYHVRSWKTKGRDCTGRAHLRWFKEGAAEERRAEWEVEREPLRTSTARMKSWKCARQSSPISDSRSHATARREDSSGSGRPQRTPSGGASLGDGIATIGKFSYLLDSSNLLDEDRWNRLLRLRLPSLGRFPPPAPPARVAPSSPTARGVGAAAASSMMARLDSIFCATVTSS